MTTQTQNPAYRPASTTENDADAGETPPRRRVFALGDTHLGAAVGKSMDRFGDHWRNHPERILANARRTVGPDDVLILAGDLSWAMRKREAKPDLEFLAALPGIKVVIKGNHDYWWESGKAINFPGLLSPPVILDGGRLGIAGTRGWYAPADADPGAEGDRKVLERERLRLKKSLAAIEACETRVAVTHYPPQPFLPELREAGVAAVAYGHVHLGSFPEDEALALDGDEIEGVRFWCVACDRIDFTPRRIV